MTSYPYTRIQEGTTWDTDTDYVADDEGAILRSLGGDINTAIPDHAIRIKCYGTTAEVLMDPALTGEEETTLDGVVAAYKAGGE